MAKTYLNACLLFSIVVSGCSAVQSPVAPTLPMEPVPVVAPAAQQGTIRLDLGPAVRAPIEPGGRWHHYVTVIGMGVSPVAPTQVSVRCPHETLTLRGGFGSLPFSCVLPAGVHVVSAAAGGSATETTVTVAAAVPVDAGLHVWAVSFDEQRGTSITFAANADGNARRYNWTFGDGNIDSTLTPFVQHRYVPGERQREVTVRITAEGDRLLAIGRIVGLW